jgi:hypothetical protein
MRKESFAHISPVYSIKSASKKPVTRNDIERIDNNPFIENKQDLDLLKGSIKFKFTQAVDAHTWYFNNVSYCYNVAGTAITTKLWPFEDVQQAVRFTTSEGADNSTTQTLPANDPPTNDPPANDPPAQISTAESSLPQTTSAANPSAQTTTDETTTTFSNLAAQTSPAKDLLATL